MAEVRAKLNRLDVAPRKVRAMTHLIAGMAAGDAEAQLIFRKERAAKPVLKLLRSAVANAKVKGLNPDILVVKAAMTDKGIRLKRFLPRARGMATPLHKDFSNVTIVLEESAKKKKKFTPGKAIFSRNVARKTAEKQKVSEKKGTVKAKRPTTESKKEAKPVAESEVKSTYKKMFRRKAV